MKRVVSILCVAVLLVSLLGLTACGKKKKIEEIHASYKMTEVVMGKSSVPLKSKGYENAELEIDGEKATMKNFNGETSEVTVDYEKLVLVSSSDKEYPFEVDGDTLTLKGDGETMTFTKQ